MSKKMFVGIVINLLLFGTGLLLNNISMTMFMLLIYLAPAAVNVVTSEKIKDRFSKIILPITTTLFYCGFSYLFMNQASFAGFVASNSREMGELSIQVNNNLLGIGQILFVFLVNFGAIYITSKLRGRDKYVTSESFK